jgi:uncharacterized membrane protein YadS
MLSAVAVTTATATVIKIATATVPVLHMAFFRFVAASLVFSFILIPAFGGGQEGLNAVDKDVIRAITKTCRGWLFCLAFVAIGLESNFRQLARQMAGGKPIILYVVGQSFNLILTVIAAYLAFGGWLLEPISF